jgi:predicted RNA-binding Zn ribbon-like protein
VAEGGWTARLEDRVYDQASLRRKLREWTRRWIARWHDAPGGNYRAEVRRLNGLLQRASRYHEMVRAADGHRLAERHRLDSGDALLGLLAESIASLIVTEDAALVKQCAGPECTLWFVDRTKAHSRLFCSATACGNRAKVAAFRERQRKSLAGTRRRPA